MNEKYTWGSHAPINKTLMKIFEPNCALEFGVGHYSTPIFCENSKKTVCLDTDKNWLEAVSAKLESEHNTFMHYPTREGISRKTRRHEVLDELPKFKSFLSQLHNEYNFDYAFIDSISSLRLEAIHTLIDKVDIIVFHDYNERGRKNHYDGGFERPDNYMFLLDTSFPAHTGILIHKKHKDRILDIAKNLESEVHSYSSGKYRAILTWF